jgi:tetratricopeptide (TPR) repeat protein
VGKVTQFWQAFKRWVLRHPRKTYIVGLAGIIVVSGVIGVVIHNTGKKDAEQPLSNPVARQFQEQLPKLKEKAEKNPSDFDAQKDYGVALYATGNKKEAKERYERAVRINNKDASTHNNLGNTYRDLGEYEQAIAAYKKAIDANPKLVNPYTNLANIQIYSLNKVDDGIDTYRQALKALPNNSQVQVLLALAYEKKGDVPSATQTLKSAQAANPEDKTIQATLTRLSQ